MRDSIRKDRARIQVGRISTFGLLEMTRQRMREGSIKWETNLSLESFALKIVKKTEMLSFTEKVKNVKVQIPEKVKIYIDNILKKEIKHFQDKFKIGIEFFADPQLIIPEYSINLIDKNKKSINRVENISPIQNLEDKFKVIDKKTKKVDKKNKTSPVVKSKKKVMKKIKKKTARVLWVRRKKKDA